MATNLTPESVRSPRLTTNMYGGLIKMNPHKNKMNSLQTGYRELLFSELFDKQTVNNLENFNQSNNNDVPQLEDDQIVHDHQTMNNDRQVPTRSPCLAATAVAAAADDLQGEPYSEPRKELDVVPDEQSEADGFNVPSSVPNTTIMKGKQVEQIVPSSSSDCSREASNSPIYTLKRTYHEDTDLSQNKTMEETDNETIKTAPPSKGPKRKRKPEVHSLSEKRRRDKINKKMKALQELIPNCNKVDKASLLDEAIEYLKTLQLQVQMMSMGRTGVYMPQMMLQASAMQHMNARNFGAYNSPMGTVGMQMGLGCNPVPQFPSMTSLMPGISQPRVNIFGGLPGQMLLMSLFPSSSPFVSLPTSFPPQLARTPAVSQAVDNVSAAFTRATLLDSNRRLDPSKSGRVQTSKLDVKRSRSHSPWM